MTTFSTTSVESNRDLLLRAKRVVETERDLPDRLRQTLREDLQVAVDVLDLLSQYAQVFRRWDQNAGPGGEFAAKALRALEEALDIYGTKPTLP